MSLDPFVALLCALVTLAGVVYVQRSTAKAKRAGDLAAATVDKMRVDGEAYDRAQKINAELVGQLQGEVGRLRQELVEVRVQLRSEVAHSAQLEDKVAKLQRSVDRLVTILEDHDIPVPKIVTRRF